MINALKIFLALFLMCAGGCALAQNAYPAKPIKFIVPFGPGGVTDVLARLLAVEMQKDWGQPVVVLNMAGATGTIGSAAVAKAAPDGYTLLITANVHTINPAMRKEMPFDTLKDFTPITLLTTAPNMLVVRADSPIKSVADYVAAALAKPGEITYATAGVGTAPHIAGEQFSQITGTRYNLIPYSSSIRSIQSVVAGERWPGLLGRVWGFLKWSPCRWLRLSTVPPPAPLRRKASGAVDNQVRITLPVRSVGF